MNSLWLSVLPAGLKERLAGRMELQRVLSNSGWLITDRLVRMGVSILLGGWLARYLGPDQFGQFNYAIAYLAIFTAVATLGLESLAIRDLVREPGNAPAILGSVFVLKFFGGVLAFCLSITSVWLFSAEDVTARVLVVITSASLLFLSFDTIDIWFQSQVQSRFTVIARNVAFFVCTGIKVALLIAKAPIVAFAWVTLFEAGLTAAGLVLLYHTSHLNVGHWSISLQRVRDFLRECLPLTFSAISVIIYMQIDQIMLARMVGNRELGWYSAAVKLSEAWYFLPAALVTSVFPAIIARKQENEAIYLARMQQLFDGLVWIFVVISLLVTITGRPLTILIFGRDYQPAATILAIHIWSSIFIALSLARGRWLVLEGLTRYTFLTHLIGCAINVVLNLLLIPPWGGIGAAIATLISYAVAAYLSCFVFKPTRSVGIMMTRAWFAPFRLAARSTRGMPHAPN